MAKLLKIAKTKDVPPGQAAAFTIEGQKIALFNVEGTYYAIGDTCTHRGGPLSEGDVQGTRVTCPWHGADFDLQTGAVLGPPAQKGVPSYKVVVEGDDIKWKYRISVRAVILSLSYFVFPFVKSGDPRPLGGLLPGSDPNYDRFR